MLSHNKVIVPLLGGILAVFLSTGPATAAANAALIAKGEKLYNQNCSVCHQPDAIGKPGFAPSLANPEFLNIASDKFLMSTMRDGRVGTGMPPFSHLGRESIKAIVAYLRRLTKLMQNGMRMAIPGWASSGTTISAQPVTVWRVMVTWRVVPVPRLGCPVFFTRCPMALSAQRSSTDVQILACGDSRVRLAWQISLIRKSTISSSTCAPCRNSKETTA